MFNEHQQEVGTIYVPGGSIDTLGVIFNEPKSFEINGISFNNVSKIHYSEEGDLLTLWAENLTLADGYNIANVEVWFNRDQTINYIRSEDRFYYQFDDQQLSLSFLGLYPDGTPWRFRTDGSITVSWDGQQIKTYNTRADFFPDGSLKSMRGYFRLDLSFQTTELENVELREIAFFADGSLENIEFINEENIIFPILGELKAEEIDFDRGNIPRRVEFEESDDFSSSRVTMNIGSFHLEDGTAAFAGDNLTRLRYAYSPVSISLPGDREFVIDRNKRKAELGFYLDGRLRSLNTTYDYYFDFTLDGGQTIRTNNVEFWQNGLVKKIYFSNPVYIDLPGLGAINCSSLEYNSSGGLAEVEIAGSGNFKYEVNGNEMVFDYLVTFYEGNQLHESRLAEDCMINLPNTTQILQETGDWISFYPDESLKAIRGTGKEFELKLPDSTIVRIPHDRDVEIDFYDNGSVERVVGFKDPCTIMFSNGATAIAYYMVEYDERGNIISFY